MKKSIILTALAVVVLAGALYLLLASNGPSANGNKAQNPSSSPSAQAPQPSDGAGASAGGSSGTAGAPAPTPIPKPSGIAAAQLAQHNSVSDCWVSVSGKVYDVTSVIPDHPGGAEVLTPFCGKDATSAFMMRGGRGPHPESAQIRINSLFKGNLAQ